MASDKWLVYGAYGYTGKLILDYALKQNLRPVVAGRDETRCRELADALNLEYRCFSLDNEESIAAEIRDFDVVLHAAGPFSKTAAPMLDACLAAKVNYLDITGEISVFESIYSLDQVARDKGICLIPGVGFDVVPTDCVAANLQCEIPDAEFLELAFCSNGQISHGTLKTMIENLGEDGALREGGAIKRVKSSSLTKELDFGDGKLRLCMSIPWGDVASAFRSTRIPNISVYTAVTPIQLRALGIAGSLQPLLKSKLCQRAMGYLADRFVDGPSAERRSRSGTRIWGSVRNASGDYAVATLAAEEGYNLTARTAVEAVKRVLHGDVRSGALTPVLAFGADFLSQCYPELEIKITRG